MDVLKTEKASGLLAKARESLADEAPEFAVLDAEEALTIFREVGHAEGQEESLAALVHAHVAKGDLEAALRAAGDALAGYKSAGDRPGQVAALRVLAAAHAGQGAAQEARQAASEMVAVCQQMGDCPGQAAALRTLVAASGRSPASRGAARQALREWLANTKKLSDKRAEATALQALVQCILADKGASASDLEEVVGHQERSRGIYRELGDKAGEADLLSGFAQDHLSRGEIAKALEKAKLQVQVLKDCQDACRLVKALAMKITVFVRMDELDRALRSTNRAMAIATDANNKQAEIEASCSMVEVQAARKDVDAAVKTAFEAVGMSKVLEDGKVGAALVARLAKIVLKLDRAEQALLISEEARALYGKLGDACGQALLFRDTLAPALMRNGDTVKAISAAEAALDLFRSTGDQAEQVSTMFTIVQMHQTAGSGEDAVQAAVDLVSLCRRSGNRPREAEALNLVAQMHSRAGEYQSALSSADAASELFQKLEDSRGKVAVLQTVARARLALNETDAALAAAKEAHSLASGLGDRAQAASATEVLASIRISRQEFKDVVQAAKASVQECQEQGDSLGEAQHWLSIANARWEQVRAASAGSKKRVLEPSWNKRLMEALMAAKEALHLFQRIGQTSGEAAVLQAMARIYSFKSEPRLALEAAKESAMIFKATDDLHGAANSLLIEAAAHLARLGVPWDADPQTLAQPRSKPAKEALAAAEEAYKLCQRYADQELQDYALKVLDAARDCFQATTAPQPQKKREVLMAIDNRDRQLLEDMGIRFKSQAAASRLLARDPRLEEVIGRKQEAAQEEVAKVDPAMERLMAIALHALSTSSR